MNPNGPVTALATCGHCREIVAVNVRAKRYRCPDCRRAVRPGFRTWEEWCAMEGVGEHDCPRCSRAPLPFEMLGVWD
jgi:predicted RNA-binding Zn-ribbon protein involved in translation (DUF1610 family)